jgi:hypothetical protein
MLRHRARQAKLLRDAALEIGGRNTDPRGCIGRSGACITSPDFRAAANVPDVSELLAKLPPPARAVLTLRIVHDMPFRDVAAALGISEEAAKKRAQRALRRLREQAARPAYSGKAPSAAEAGTRPSRLTRTTVVQGRLSKPAGRAAPTPPEDGAAADFPQARVPGPAFGT